MLPGLKEMSRQLNLEDRIHWLGNVPDPKKLLQSSDVFVLASVGEAFGLVLAEAMACGVPVVASNVGGLPEVVEDGVSGFLRPLEDVTGMAEAAVMLLTDSALHAQFAKAALSRVRKHFCAKRVVPQYEAYYEEIIRA